MSSLQHLSLPGPRVSGFIAIAIATVALAGWASEIEVLQGVWPGLPPMPPLAAAGLILLGAALALLGPANRTRHARVAAEVAATLTAALVCVGVAIDPASLRPVTAACYLLLASAVIGLDARRPLVGWLPQLFAAAAGLLAWVGVLGKIFELAYLYGTRGSAAAPVGMALHTAVPTLLLATGTLQARPGRGLMRVAASDTSAGMVLRRMSLTSMIVPLFVGTVVLAGLRGELYDVPMAFVLLAVASMTLFTALLAETAILLFRSDQGRTAVEHALRRSQAELEQRVVDRTRELVVAKQVADDANRAKSEFLACMSHEIRTPLNAVIGMTDLALELPLPTEATEYLSMSKTAADALLSVIDDILDFSKIEAGKLELEPIPFGLRELLSDTLRTLAFRAHRKGLEIVSRIAPGTPEWLVGDPGRLRQVLINLVGNALKFTEKGHVVVVVEADRLRADEVELKLAVQDTGIGIAEEKQATIFNAFEQADRSTTRRYGGSGLGLSICAHLVRLMGGGIAVESAPGKGSTFRFSVRMGVGARPDDVVPLVPPDALRGRPVLIVDDSPVAREVLGELLAAWGIAVTTVDGARVGFVTLKRAQEDGTPFGAVVVDAHMPGTDGFAFVDAVRREEGLTLPPVVMLTREGEPRDAARCRVLDVAGLVTKPIREAELLDAVSAVLGCPRPSGEGRDARGRRRMMRPQHCLVVEDNDYNQLLIVRLLENHGHSAVVAAHGREALAALGKERFDVILMDIEMPDMDGFEATARIQARFDDGDCPPIIAITAHALKGDRERCLAAGMDAYLSKPLRASELFATMERLAGEGPAPEPVDEGDTPPLDTAALLDRVEGNTKLARELAELLRARLPGMVAAVRAAVEQGDARALALAAHSLKGAFRLLSAASAAETAQRLEAMGRHGTVDDGAALCAALEAEVARLGPALARLAQA